MAASLLNQVKGRNLSDRMADPIANIPLLTRSQIKGIYPKASDVDVDAFLTFGEEALKKSGILDMVTRLQYFLAQLGHESNGLTHREENLNYSAARLMEIWPSRFPTLDIAKQYERNPEKLANFVYSGRMGNVNPGDGYRFRGRGYIQLTGRETYREIGRIAGLDLESHPELAAKPENAVKIACAFWTWKNINPACDVADFTAVTKKINGGTHGLYDRLQWLSKVKTVLGSTHASPDAAADDPAESLSNLAVLEAQKKLTRLGYYKGVINGIYNQMLRAGLWAFQKDENLPQTGQLDAKTREELNI
jgi:putative chitinase